MPYLNDVYGGAKYEEMAELKKKADKEMEQKLEIYLAGLADTLNRDGIKVKTSVIHPRPLKTTAEVIIDYAEENKVDLIIMSTHGRSGISRWAFGSIADKVVHYSKTPVMIVTPSQCRI
jgi:nucleotide-binding universal stress UspA family protein